MRAISARLHSTTNVSIELEKVCDWYVQVTYEDATIMMATRRCFGDGTNSCNAQSSSTKLSTNIKIRSVQYTTLGGTSPPTPSHIDRSINIGNP